MGPMWWRGEGERQERVEQRVGGGEGLAGRCAARGWSTIAAGCPDDRGGRREGEAEGGVEHRQWRPGGVVADGEVDGGVAQRWVNKPIGTHRLAVLEAGQVILDA